MNKQHSLRFIFLPPAPKLMHDCFYRRARPHGAFVSISFGGKTREIHFTRCTDAASLVKSSQSRGAALIRRSVFAKISGALSVLTETSWS